MRKSNIELLRILCMFMIILWHINIAVDKAESYTHSFILKDLIYSITAVSVNCFVLISGYFGIIFKPKTIFNLLLQCLFYSVVIGLVLHYMADIPINMVSVLMPVSSNAWWFMTTYIMLYLSSPLLNKGIDNLNVKELCYTIFAFTIICVYFGYIFKNPNNSSGHSYLQFVYMYIIGRAIHKTSDVDMIVEKHKKYVWGGLWIFIYVITLAMNIFLLKSYRYNNPLVILSSFSLFMFFENLRIASYAYINRISITVLAAYLIHEHPMMRPLLAEYVYGIHKNYSLSNEVILYIGIAILILVLAFITEYVRKFMFIPINNILNKYL